MFRYLLIVLALWCPALLRAQVPQFINYQGRVAVGSTQFEGNGHFPLPLVSPAGTATYWGNDGTGSSGGQPTAAVTLPVVKGLYSVRLGDATLSNMRAIPYPVFGNSDLRLRVWFDDGTHGSQLLTPDQPIAAVGYAVMANTVPDGAITSAKLASGAVGAGQLANGAVGAGQLASGAAAGNLAAGGQSAVASGGLVLAAAESAALTSAGFVKLGTTVLSDGWQYHGNGSPTARTGHTAVWAGTEMIGWGV